MSDATLAFQSLLRQLAPELQPDSPRACHLVFDEGLVVEVRLHPDDAQVVVDAWIADLAPLAGPARRVAVDMLLAFNGSQRGRRPWFAAADERGLVLLHGRWPLAGLEALAFEEALQELLDDAQALRDLVDALAGEPVLEHAQAGHESLAAVP